METIDQRIDAHLDGLVVNGDAGWEAARQELRWQEPGEVFTATVLALLTDCHRLAQVLSVLDGQLELEDAFANGLSWLPDSVGRPVIEMLWSSNDERHRRRALQAMIDLRNVDDPRISAAAQSSDQRLVTIALLGGGQMGLVEMCERLRGFVTANEIAVRFASAWSLVRLSQVPVALAELRRIAESDSDFGDEAAGLTVHHLPYCEAVTWIRTLANEYQAHSVCRQLSPFAYRRHTGRRHTECAYYDGLLSFSRNGLKRM